MWRILNMTTSSHIYKLAIVAPTCFYYQSALFRDLASSPRIDLRVYFCSQEGITGQDVVSLHKTNDVWGLGQELLEGYDYKFLRNHSPIGSYLKRFGLMNPGILNEIKKERPDVVVLMAWNNPTFWLAVLACWFYRIPILYMTDANLEVEMSKGKSQTRIKGALLGKVLFGRLSGFLCSGEANRRLFRHWGVPEEKLITFAYSWGYNDQIIAASKLKPQKKQLRSQLGIPEQAYVILFCGRLSEEKNLFKLLDAYKRVRSTNKALVLVGDGELKQPLQTYAEDLGLDSVHFYGFQNRNEIDKFYAVSDVLVLPSVRETWGIVVNEAMCFGLPTIVSDIVGAGEDLVEHGYNGFRYPHNEVEKLTAYIDHLMALPEDEQQLFSSRARDRIQQWSQRDLSEILVTYLDTFCFSNKARMV